MAQSTEMLATKTNDLSSNPTWWKKTANSYKVPSDLHICVVTGLHAHKYTHTLTHTNTNIHTQMNK